MWLVYKLKHVMTQQCMIKSNVCSFLKLQRKETFCNMGCMEGGLMRLVRLRCAKIISLGINLRCADCEFAGCGGWLQSWDSIQF